MSHLRSLLKPGQMLHLPRVIVSAFVSAEAEAQQVETPVKTKSKVDHASVGLPCLLAALSLSFDTGPGSTATSLVAPVDSVNLFSTIPWLPTDCPCSRRVRPIWPPMPFPSRATPAFALGSLTRATTRTAATTRPFFVPFPGRGPSP